MLKNITSNKYILKNYFCESKEQNDNDNDNKKNDEEENADIDETDHFKNFIIFRNYLNRNNKMDDKQNNETKFEDKEIQKDFAIDDIKKSNDLLGKKRKIRRIYENKILFQLEEEEIKNNKNE